MFPSTDMSVHSKLEMNTLCVVRLIVIIDQATLMIAYVLANAPNILP